MSDWNPERAELRSDQQQDEMSHAERNAAQLQLAQEVYEDETNE